MKGRVLLIVHDVYQKHNNFPLGPAYLAAALVKEGVDVEVYCQDVFHYTNEHLAKHLQNNQYDIIGLGFLAARFKETVEPLCKVINENKRDAWLVLGGHGPSAIPEYMLETTQADIVAIGDSEHTIVDIVRCKTTGGDLSRVDGIAYRTGDKVDTNKRRMLEPDLDSLPLPAWDLFPMEEYCKSAIRPGQTEAEKSLDMITTRGCTSQCSFCYRMQKGIIARKMSGIIDEMKILESRYGVTYFHIADELTFFNKKRVFEFEEALNRAGLNIKYYCDIRANLIDQDVAESLKRSGCQLANIGFESLDQAVLDRMNKGTKVEDNLRAAEVCKENGIVMGLNVMWANPLDSEGSIWKLVDFLKRYNTYGQIRTIRPVTPYPGCALYYDALEMGLLKGPGDFFEKFKNSDLITVNFTNLPTEECHRLLFAANTELILDHHLKTHGSMEAAKALIDGFYGLYFENDYKFRGARQYARKKENK